MWAAWLCLALVSVQAASVANESSEVRERRLAAEVAARTGWSLQRSESFFLATAVQDRALLAELADRATKIRQQIKHALIPSNQPTCCPGPAVDSPAPVPSVIVLYRKRDSSAPVPAGRIGHWSARDQTLHLVDPQDGRAAFWRELPRLVCSEFIDRNFGEGDIAPWLVHGYQEYFASFEWRGEQYWSRRAPRADAANKVSAPEASWISFRQLIALDERSFSEPSVSGASLADVTAQCGRAIGFLRHGASSKAWQPRWGEISGRYFEEWRRSRSSEKAHAAAFEGVDLDELDRAFRDFVSQDR